MFFFLCCGFVFGLVWYGSQSEKVAFSHLCFVGDYFLFSVFSIHLTGLLICRLLFCSVFSYFIKNMNTYHTALWSSPSSTTDDRYMYRMYGLCSAPLSFSSLRLCVFSALPCELC